MRKKKKYVLLGVIIILGGLIAFHIYKNAMSDTEAAHGNLGIYTDKEMDEMFDKHFSMLQMDVLSNYSLGEVEECVGLEIGGILCRKEDICVVDSAEHRLFTLDAQGNISNIIGSVGNGPLEFLNPSGIAEHGGRIYVLDAGNRRIQVLDSDFTYEKEIKFPEDMDADIKNVNSIAVDGDGNIFTSCAGIGYSQILCYRNADGSFVELGENFYGTVAGYDGEVYAINIGMAVGENKRKASGWRSGANYLYSVTTDSMQRICELPYGISVLGFVVVRDGLVCMSGGYGTVDFYGLDGVYKHSFAQKEEIKMMGALDTDECGNIYIGLPEAEKMYKIEKMEQ